MPALDYCHQQVVRALRKNGWEIDPRPYFVRIEGLTLFADIQAHRRTSDNGQIQQIIIVEVKCFTDQRSDQDELYRALGQYLLYRSALRARGISSPLYLAIPTLAYLRLFSKSLVLDTVREAGIKLIIVDVDREEVVEWLD